MAISAGEILANASQPFAIPGHRPRGAKEHVWMNDLGQQEILRRDRRLLIAALAAIALLAWTYLLYQAHLMGRDLGMGAMPGMAMPALHPWTSVDLLLLFAMWAVMMAAMMVPAVAPTVLLMAHISRQRQNAPVPRALLFVIGYLSVWTLFSLIATIAQWQLHRAALISGAMQATPLVGGLLLIFAGLFQWTPLKRKCLVHCRSPFAFLMRYWREGGAGAYVMGLRHGVYCVACCWLLMALLFVLGVMNLLWVAALAAFLVMERLTPKGDIVGRVAGFMLVIAGILVIARGVNP